jgi:hypothetical protein
MSAIALMFAVAGALPLQSEALPVAPFDLERGQQQVVLREPLFARSAGARLVLFVRGRDRTDFETRHPTGSVTAHLRDTAGHELTLAHTGYTYYRGFAGLVLTEQTPSDRRLAYGALELDTKVALDDVRVVWLDRRARQVQDLRPAL